MTDDIASLTLRLLQDMRGDMSAIRAEMATKAEIFALRTELKAEIAAFRAETNKKFDLLAETILKQSGQIEILTMGFSRQSERLDRIESRLDRVDQRLGLDQNTH